MASIWHKNGNKSIKYMLWFVTAGQLSNSCFIFSANLAKILTVIFLSVRINFLTKKNCLSDVNGKFISRNTNYIAHYYIHSSINGTLCWTVFKRIHSLVIFFFTLTKDNLLKASNNTGQFLCMYVICCGRRLRNFPEREHGIPTAYRRRPNKLC